MSFLQVLRLPLIIQRMTVDTTLESQAVDDDAELVFRVLGTVPPQAEKENKLLKGFGRSDRVRCESELCQLKM